MGVPDDIVWAVRRRAVLQKVAAAAVAPQGPNGFPKFTFNGAPAEPPPFQPPTGPTPSASPVQGGAAPATGGGASSVKSPPVVGGRSGTEPNAPISNPETRNRQH